MILSGDLPPIPPPAQRHRHDGQHLPHGAGKILSLWKILDNYHCGGVDGVFVCHHYQTLWMGRCLTKLQKGYLKL